MFPSNTGLPVQVRDSALNIEDNIPKSAVNKEYFNQIVEKEVCLLYLLLMIRRNKVKNFLDGTRTYKTIWSIGQSSIISE